MAKVDLTELKRKIVRWAYHPNKQKCDIVREQVIYLIEEYENGVNN